MIVSEKFYIALQNNKKEIENLQTEIISFGNIVLINLAILAQTSDTISNLSPHSSKFWLVIFHRQYPDTEG